MPESLPEDRLYGLPPEEFTAARNALAADLRAAGDAEGAARVKALRKPNRAAWAVNRLVRAEPDLVEALLGAGGELRQAHRQATSGRGAEQLRAAALAERAAVDALVARAADVLGTPPAPALAESIRNSFHAASGDDAARELVAAGRLVEPLQPVGIGPMPAGRAGRGSQPEQKTDDRLRSARAEESALTREAEDAERSVHRAERQRSKAGHALEEAEQKVNLARGAARVAEQQVRAAGKRLEQARAALARARKTRERLEGRP